MGEWLVYLEIARIRVKPGMEQRFIDVSRSHVANLDKFVGASSFAVRRCHEDPREFYYLIEWNTIEDHTEKFRASDFGKQAHAEIVPLLDGDPVVHHSTLLAEKRS